MTIVRKSQAPEFDLHGIRVTGLASPRRGASPCASRMRSRPSVPPKHTGGSRPVACAAGS